MWSTNIKHLPTSRNNLPQVLISNEQTYSKKFVYLGFISEEKGIDLIIEAKKQFGSDYQIDLYGPIVDSKYKEKLSKMNLYRGILKKEEILTSLQNYDVLILPIH